MEKNKQKFKLKLKERREKAKEEAKERVIDVTVAENEFEGEEKNMTPPPSPPKNAFGSPLVQFDPASLQADPKMNRIPTRKRTVKAPCLLTVDLTIEDGGSKRRREEPMENPISQPRAKWFQGHQRRIWAIPCLKGSG